MTTKVMATILSTSSFLFLLHFEIFTSYLWQYLVLGIFLNTKDIRSPKEFTVLIKLKNYITQDYSRLWISIILKRLFTTILLLNETLTRKVSGLKI